MGRVLAVANQKGGVAKTTTTHSLGAGLAELGERVLLVDLDPQACLTYSLGIDSDALDRSLHDVLAGRAEAAGKRALFSGPETTRPANGAATATATMKKDSLFSASEGGRRYGTVVVECSSCGARTRLSWAEFTWRHLPLWLWVPFVRYSRFISCPACDRRTWLSVHWFA